MSKVREFAGDIRRGWWILCNHHATNIRDGWALYEADWYGDTDGHPLGKTDQQRRDLALAWAAFLEALGGERPRERA